MRQNSLFDEITETLVPFARRTESLGPALARWQDPATSHEAARKQRGGAAQAILAVFARHPEGLTDDEMAAELKTLHAPTVKSARSRLSKRGLLCDSGQTRLSSRGSPMIVWTRT